MKSSSRFSSNIVWTRPVRICLYLGIEHQRRRNGQGGGSVLNFVSSTAAPTLNVSTYRMPSVCSSTANGCFHPSASDTACVHSTGHCSRDGTDAHTVIVAPPPIRKDNYNLQKKKTRHQSRCHQPVGARRPYAEPILGPRRTTQTRTPLVIMVLVVVVLRVVVVVVVVVQVVCWVDVWVVPIQVMLTAW